MFRLYLPLLYLVYLLVLHTPLSYVRADLSLIASDKSEPLLTVATQAFFHVRSQPFNRTGPGVEVNVLPSKDSKSAPCVPGKLAAASAPGAVHTYNESILIVYWARMMQCNVTTLTVAVQLAVSFADQLATSGYPPAHTILLMMNTLYPGVPGNPSYEPYMARSALVPDGSPPAGWDVQLVAEADAVQVVAALKKAKDKHAHVVAYTVTYNDGAWNAVFLNVGFLVYIYVMFVLNVAGVFYALYQLYLLIKDHEFKFGLRNVIVMLGMIGTSLYSASILLRPLSYAANTLETISSFIISIAFHILLYLWSVFLMQVRHNKSVYYFRGLVAFGATVVVFSFCANMAVLNMPPSHAIVILNMVLDYLLSITQLIIGVAFLGYAIKFVRRRETVKISQNTYKALTRLGQVAVIAFIGYFAVAVTNLDVVMSLLITPAALAVARAARLFSASVRGLAVLTVLGARTAKKSTATGGSNKFSATGSMLAFGTTSTVAEPEGMSRKMSSDSV